MQSTQGEGNRFGHRSLGYAVACSVFVYVKVVSSTKGWSDIGTCVNSVTVVTLLDVHLDRNVAIDVI